MNNIKGSLYRCTHQCLGTFWSPCCTSDLLVKYYDTTNIGNGGFDEYLLIVIVKSIALCANLNSDNCL